ncbi:hypothetical protein Q4503_06100 [Colwellia sp. 6_MG-2023]|uniref:hypothetical protein n=1 Tax=Colwellia sp. 6_MG-2023 TaxID=3062676 RepID=UPI0026E2BE31|nr:hypothetical protein [Colwellia sp. 6_MG-2023]MDO6487264.1 hypothetical protein [Colwellia sp. 6_MG-2023]
MRYHQLKEIYQHVMEINQELNGLYTHFLENTKDERTRIFLHYIIEKQAENILDIQKLISDEAIGVLSTWIDEDIEHKVSESIISFKENSDVNITTVLDVTTQIRVQLNEWLNVIKALMPSETVKTHLENLIELQSAKSQQIIHAANRMDDI